MDTEKIKRQTGINKVIFKKEVTSTNDEILNEKQDDTLMIAFFNRRVREDMEESFSRLKMGCIFRIW